MSINKKMNGGPRFAFTAVVQANVGFIIGKAIEGKKGYIPVSEKGIFDSYDKAMAEAEKMNDQIGLSRKEAFYIALETMTK